jgi:hypothetical protein
MGPINPVNHNIKNRAASSGQGRALFKIYLQNTCNNVTATINAIATTEIRFPMVPARVFTNASGDKIPNNSVFKRVPPFAHECAVAF